MRLRLLAALSLALAACSSSSSNGSPSCEIHQSGSTGCSTATSPTGSTGSTGSSSGSTSGTASSAGTSSTGSTGSSSTGSTGSSSSGSTGGGATITDINQGNIAPGTTVQLQGVLAMSSQFLVSKSASSCLWGTFLSEPNLIETQPYSGLMAVSYGTPPSVPDGGSTAQCPRLGIDPVGDAFPDDLKPGDVLTLTGTTATFLSSSCSSQSGGATVGQNQLTNVTGVSRTATGQPLPVPHALSASEMLQLAAPSDPFFHAQWGGAKVLVQNVKSEPQQDGGSITDAYGTMYVADSSIANPTPADTLQVGDKLYYRGYLKASNFCFGGPVYANPSTTFTAMDGFSYLAFCTWTLQPEDKCADLMPPSDDCSGNAAACQ